MKIARIRGFFKKYNQLYLKLKLLCFDTDPKKTALALTLGICVGIIPLLGTTLILITILGFTFRLNQVIIQTTHLLVSPLQILFIPIFFKAGKWLFGPSHVYIAQETANKVPLNFFQMINKFGHLMVYSLIVWLIFSVAVGFMLYRFWLIVLPGVKTKFRNNIQ